MHGTACSGEESSVCTSRNRREHGWSLSGGGVFGSFRGRVREKELVKPKG